MFIHSILFFFLLSSSHCLSTSNTAVTFFSSLHRIILAFEVFRFCLAQLLLNGNICGNGYHVYFFFLAQMCNISCFCVYKIYTLQISNIQPCITFCFAFVTRSVKHAYSPILPQPLFPNQQKTPQMPAEKWYCEPIIIFHRVPSISKWMGSYIFFLLFYGPGNVIEKDSSSLSGATTNAYFGKKCVWDTISTDILK